MSLYVCNCVSTDGARQDGHCAIGTEDIAIAAIDTADKDTAALQTMSKRESPIGRSFASESQGKHVSHFPVRATGCLQAWLARTPYMYW